MLTPLRAPLSRHLEGAHTSVLQHRMLKGERPIVPKRHARSALGRLSGADLSVLGLTDVWELGSISSSPVASTASSFRKSWSNILLQRPKCIIQERVPLTVRAPR